MLCEQFQRRLCMARFVVSWYLNGEGVYIPWKCPVVQIKNSSGFDQYSSFGTNKVDTIYCGPAFSLQTFDILRFSQHSAKLWYHTIRLKFGMIQKLCLLANTCTILINNWYTDIICSCCQVKQIRLKHTSRPITEISFFVQSLQNKQEKYYLYPGWGASY